MRRPVLVSLAALAASSAVIAPATAAVPLALTPAGSYATGLGEGSAEIVALDGDRAFVINTATTAVDILDVASDGSMALRRRVQLGAYGAGGNSVAAHDGVIAVALDAPVRTDPGTVVLLDRDGDVLTSITAGAVPDMVTFTPDGKYLLVANEGEPDDTYTVDPEGSVTIVHVTPLLARRGGRAGAAGGLIRTADFRSVPVPAGVRIFGPGASAAQDIEPEYIAVDPDGRTAYVTLQENNAIAVVDIRHARVTKLLPLGLKDHRLAVNALDASDQNGPAIAPTTVPVFGMYQPDAISAFTHDGRTYLLTANEGDVREWGPYAEGARASTLTGRLDPTAFPAGLPSALRRLTVSTATGDTDGDGDLDQLHAFGARSFSIWTTDGTLVVDSGDQLERTVLALAPAAFNVSNSNNTVDNRSDDKGPEPEGVTVGEVDGRRYAFVTLERVGGVVVYDISDPATPVFQSWANNRTYGPGPVGPDSGPEGVTFAPSAASPTGTPLLLVGNEVSGTVTSYVPAP